MSAFLNSFTNSYELKILDGEHPFNKAVIVKNNKNIYPTVASLELTYKCNLRCRHCYGEYGDVNKIEMDINNLKKLLVELKELGIRIIEFTGGDVSIYPHFKEALLYAIDLDFDFICILTNGIALDDDIIEIIINNKNKVVMQIDLHSLDDNYLEWFTQVPNTIDRIKNIITKFTQNDVLIRIATVVTPKNVDEIETIADWVHNIGIKTYALSPVINLGRATFLNDNLLFNNKEQLAKFEKVVNNIMSKYSNFLTVREDAVNERPNCGSLTSNVTIMPDGNIKHCTMDNSKYANTSIGNVFDKPIKQIYDENTDYIEAVFALEPPKYDSIECRECDKKYFCGNCILRGFISRKDKGEECKWYTNKVPQIIKEKLSI